uniref:Uncharacterized protein n=2 Tax=Xenopus tropicalis TaxID=8364 RepID=A0A1B8XSK8_XENTR
MATSEERSLCPTPSPDPVGTGESGLMLRDTGRRFMWSGTFYEKRVNGNIPQMIPLCGGCDSEVVGGMMQPGARCPQCDRTYWYGPADMDPPVERTEEGETLSEVLEEMSLDVDEPDKETDDPEGVSDSGAGDPSPTQDVPEDACAPTEPVAVVEAAADEEIGAPAIPVLAVAAAGDMEGLEEPRPLIVKEARVSLRKPWPKWGGKAKFHRCYSGSRDLDWEEFMGPPSPAFDESGREEVLPPKSYLQTLKGAMANIETRRHYGDSPNQSSSETPPSWSDQGEGDGERALSPPMGAPTGFLAPPKISKEEEKFFWVLPGDANPDVFKSRVESMLEEWVVEDIKRREKMPPNILSHPERARRMQAWQYIRKTEKEWWWGRTIMKHAVHSCGKRNPGPRLFSTEAYLEDGRMVEKPHPRYYTSYEDVQQRFTYLV